MKNIFFLIVFTIGSTSLISGIVMNSNKSQFLKPSGNGNHFATFYDDEDDEDDVYMTLDECYDGCDSKYNNCTKDATSCLLDRDECEDYCSIYYDCPSEKYCIYDVNMYDNLQELEFQNGMLELKTKFRRK